MYKRPVGGGADICVDAMTMGERCRERRTGVGARAAARLIARVFVSLDKVDSSGLAVLLI